MKNSLSAAANSKSTKGFQRYDGCGFAVSIPGFRSIPLRGKARFERDDLLGNILRIPVEGKSPGEPEIILAENDWNGLITDGSKYGCQYCVTLLPEQG